MGSHFILCEADSGYMRLSTGGRAHTQLSAYGRTLASRLSVAIDYSIRHIST